HTGIEPMHPQAEVTLGCTDCHGGNAGANNPGAPPASPQYLQAMNSAHVLPRFPERWSDPQRPGWIRSAHPERTYTLLNHESPEFIRFMNPGDLRVAQASCGACHLQEVPQVQKSTMTTASIFWGAAAYNNGIVSVKHSIFGESYGLDGVPQKINQV